MSASREKKRRQQNQGSASVAPQAKKGMSKGLVTFISVLASVAFVAIVVLLAMHLSGFFAAHDTAAVVSGHKLSSADVNYWLLDTYTEEQAQMGGLVDAELPLSEQECPEEGYDTWYDYMLELALTTAASTYTIYDEAIEEGFELSDEAKADLDEQLKNLDTYSAMYGFPNSNSYLSQMYGIGCKKASYKEYLTVNFIAQNYSADKYSGENYTKEELDAYYAENSNEVDVVSFRMYELLADTTGEEGAETVTDETMQAASEKAIATAEAVKGNEDAFLEFVTADIGENAGETFDAATYTLVPGTPVSSCPENFRDWLGDDSRTFGDVDIAENETGTGYYILFFLEQIDMEIQLPSVRHILIQPEKDEEGNISDEAWADAKAQADDILAEYLAGEQTEEAFAALADEKTSDTGSAGNGGLYEEIVPGQMVTEFNDWCFAEHEVGDTDVIETTYGYHVMYFIGLSEDTYKDIVTRTAKSNGEYTAWEERIKEAAQFSLVNAKEITVF